MLATDRKAIAYATVIALGGFLFGFDAAVISGVVGFISPEFGLNDWQVGQVVGAPTLGAILAALSVGPTADYIGRKKMMLLLALLYTISAVASALATDVTTLIAARFIGGLAFGTLMLAPIYIAEIAPARLRGRMVSINQLNIVLGFAAAYFANYYLLEASQSNAAWVRKIGLDVHTWRWMLGLEALPAASYLFFMLWVPESPRWLVLQGKTAEARAIMQRIAPADQIQSLLDSIKNSASTTRLTLTARVKELFQPQLRNVIIIGFIAGISQQIVGINSVYFYAPSIFEQSGVGTNAAFAQATYVGIINVVFTVLAMVLIDLIGRRPLMLLGLAGVVISMAISSYGFSQATYSLSDATLVTLSAESDIVGLDSLAGVTYHDDVSFKRALATALGDAEYRKHEALLIQNSTDMNPTIVLVGILGFVASFAFSLGPVMWVLFSEIFPNRLRGFAMALMGVVNSSISYVVQLVFPWELSNLGSAWTFGLYGAAAGVCLVLIYWRLPETKGRSLEELENELAQAT